MSKKLFSEQEIIELSKNKYVKNVTSKGITYTNEFKLQFIAELSYPFYSLHSSLLFIPFKTGCLNTPLSFGIYPTVTFL